MRSRPPFVELVDTIRNLCVGFFIDTTDSLYFSRDLLTRLLLKSSRYLLLMHMLKKEAEMGSLEQCLLDISYLEFSSLELARVSLFLSTTIRVERSFCCCRSCLL
jgi:hypothetical protein